MLGNAQGCGPKLSQPFAFFDQESCSWKTSRPSFTEDSLPSSETWPRSGTCRPGGVYPLPPLEPLTDASGGSSLLPTPAASDGSRGPDYAAATREGTGGDSLTTTVALLPTPVAHDDGKSPAAHLAMKARMPGGARKAITSLAVLARANLLPTPTATDAKASSGSNPDWGHGVTLTDAARTISGTTAQPSKGGKPSPDQHQLPLWGGAD